MRRLVLTAILAALCVRSALAGPPYVTDDPEPVGYRHWEVYLASQLRHEGGGWSGTAPNIEVNYGAAPRLQLHLIVPAALDAPAHGPTEYGIGDVEIGAKYRFVEEGEWRPQVGTFPLVETPTGDEHRGLGSGHVQVFVPLWLQKTVGRWTSYGGGGWWIEPGKGHRDWGFVGWQIQRQIRDDLSVGGEVFHETPQEAGGGSTTRFDLGFVLDFTDDHHLLFSSGTSFQHGRDVQIYAAYQLTFGPGSPD